MGRDNDETGGGGEVSGTSRPFFVHTTIMRSLSLHARKAIREKQKQTTSSLVDPMSFFFFTRHFVPCPERFDSTTLKLHQTRKTSTEVTFCALNNKIERRCIETVHLTEISVEFDSSVPCVVTV